MKSSSLLFAALVLLSATAQAQYRFVAPDGTVTYSDQPPTSKASQVSVTGPTSAPTLLAASTPLPYSLNQAASNFPVTIYTNSSCSPCDSERSYLKGRGIPFSEKTVSNDNDIAVLKRVSGATSLPVTMVGSHKLNGFNESSLSSLLDDAGYPASSALPRDYIYPAAVNAAGPVTPASTSTAASGPTVTTPAPALPQAAPEPPPAAGNAPPGFKF
jgi:glutaredoxin